MTRTRVFPTSRGGCLTEEWTEFQEGMHRRLLYSIRSVLHSTCSKAGRREVQKQGTSFDLETGWNLSSADQRREMWRRLRTEDPELVIACLPCKAFSIIQSLNLFKMDWVKAVQLIEVGLDDLETAALVAEWQ